MKTVPTQENAIADNLEDLGANTNTNPTAPLERLISIQDQIISIISVAYPSTEPNHVRAVTHDILTKLEAEHQGQNLQDTSDLERPPQEITSDTVAQTHSSQTVSQAIPVGAGSQPQRSSSMSSTTSKRSFDIALLSPILRCESPPPSDYYDARSFRPRRKQS